MAAGLIFLAGCSEQQRPSKEDSLKIIRPITADICKACSAIARTDKVPQDVNFKPQVAIKNRRVEERGFDKGDISLKCTKPTDDFSQVLVSVRTSTWKMINFKLCDSNTKSYELPAEQF